MKQALSRAGFTLIELLVYMALLVVISTAAVAYLLSLHDLIVQYQVETSLYRSSSNALEQIQTALRQADQFDALQSVLNTGSGALAVEIDGATTRIVRNGATLELYVDGKYLGNMVEDDVTVMEFVVTRHTTAVGDMIRVFLSLQTTHGGTTKTFIVRTGSVIRGDV